MQVLDSDRVFVIGRDSIVIYNIPPFQSTNRSELRPHDEHIPEAVPVWRYPVPRTGVTESGLTYKFTCSQAFFDGKACKLVIGVLRSVILGITIPADQVSLPCVEVLLRRYRTPEHITCLGLSRGFSLRSDGECVTYRYSWSNFKDGNTGALGEGGLPGIRPTLNIIQGLGFDEGSGRAVLPYDCYFHVLDFI